MKLVNMPETVALQEGFSVSFAQLEPIDDTWEIRIFREVIGWVKLVSGQLEVSFVGEVGTIAESVEEIASKAWGIYCVNLAVQVYQGQEWDTTETIQWFRSSDPMAKSSAIFIVREYLRGYSVKPVIDDCPF
jgi:hypothetical protein